LPAAQWFVASPLWAATVSSARVWPAQEYTRLILESGTPIAHQMLTVKNPSRLVLDLEDVELTSEIEQLPRLVHPGDPSIQSIRVGRFKPGVLRLVLDLKSEVNPQLFARNRQATTATASCSICIH
jgi:N-acetylmuramoyl-L-alanine amidase